MKVKHWIVWQILLVLLTVKILMKEIPLHHSLSQMDWSLMWAFLGGTIGTAIALFWAEIE